jgi:hypothetical protein
MNKPHDTDLWQKAAQLAELLQPISKATGGAK